LRRKNCAPQKGGEKHTKGAFWGGRKKTTPSKKCFGEDSLRGLPKKKRVGCPPKIEEAEEENLAKRRAKEKKGLSPQEKNAKTREDPPKWGEIKARKPQKKRPSNRSVINP